MANRNKRHKKYYAIPAYQILARKTDEEVAATLGIARRTYKDKIMGYADFSASEGRMLSEMFAQSQDNLFLT